MTVCMDIELDFLISMKMPYPFIALSGLQWRWFLSARHLRSEGHFVVLLMVSLSIKISIGFSL